jgi:hypothetical protein
VVECVVLVREVSDDYNIDDNAYNRDPWKINRERFPVPSPSAKSLVGKVYKSILLLHMLLRSLRHDKYCSSLVKEWSTIKYILCSQVQNVKEVTDALFERMKNVGDQIMKVPMRQQQ